MMLWYTVRGADDCELLLLFDSFHSIPFCVLIICLGCLRNSSISGRLAFSFYKSGARPPYQHGLIGNSSFGYHVTTDPPIEVKNPIYYDTIADFILKHYGERNKIPVQIITTHKETWYQTFKQLEAPPER